MVAYPHQWREAHAINRLAQSWAQSGVISDGQLRSITNTFPREFRSAHPVLACGTLLVTVIALGATVVLVKSILGVGDEGFGLQMLTFLGALYCFAVAEWSLRRLRLMHAGVDWGAQVTATGLLFITMAEIIDGTPAGDTALPFALAAVAVVAVPTLRYGTTLFAVVLYGCLTWLFYQVIADVFGTPEALRLPALFGWAVATMAAASAVHEADLGERWHGQLVAVKLASLALTYGSVNYVIARYAYVEAWDMPISAEMEIPHATLHFWLTAILPPAFTVLGIWRRSRMLIRVGIVTAVLSATTFQYHFFADYVREFLVVSGALVLISTLSIWSWLRVDRRGFIAHPVLGHELDDLNLDTWLLGHSTNAVKHR